MIYLLTAIGMSPGGSSTVHIYTQTIHKTSQNKTVHRTTQTIHRTTQTIHRTTQSKQKTTQKLGRVRAVPSLCEFYSGICLTTEEKARKNLSQGIQDK
jgi:hypothetical protein